VFVELNISNLNSI